MPAPSSLIIFLHAIPQNPSNFDIPQHPMSSLEIPPSIAPISTSPSFLDVIKHASTFQRPEIPRHHRHDSTFRRKNFLDILDIILIYATPTQKQQHPIANPRLNVSRNVSHGNDSSVLPVGVQRLPQPLVHHHCIRHPSNNCHRSLSRVHDLLGCSNLDAVDCCLSLG